MTERFKLLPAAVPFALLFVLVFALNRADGETSSPEVRMADVPELFNSGVPRGESDILAQIYATAARLLRQIVLHPPGTKDSSRLFNQARAAQLIAQVDQLRRELGRETALWIGRNVPAAYRDGVRLGDRQASEAGVRPPESPLAGSFSVVDTRAVGVFARQIARDLDGAADAMATRATRLIRATAQQGLTEADIHRLLAGGLIAGKPRETIRRLREELVKVHGERVRIIDKNGDPIEFKAGYYASMVARTKTREATVVARHERLQEHGLDLVSIVGRVSKNFCTAFLGQVFSLSGKSDRYPAYDELPEGGPPFHPNCSKSTRPFIESLASATQLDRAEGLDDARRLFGMDSGKAQRTFKDLQIYSQQKERYVTTEKALFGSDR